MRDVGGEPPLQPGHPLQPGDLPLQVVGHLVEAGGQQGQVVLAAHHHPLVEQAGGEPLGGPRGPPDRVDDQPGDQHADADDEQRQRDPADDDRAADEGEALLLLGQREGVVQLDLLAAPVSVGTGAPISRVGCGLSFSSGTTAYLHAWPPSSTVGAQVGRQRPEEGRPTAPATPRSPVRWTMTRSKSPAAPPRLPSWVTVRASAVRTLAASPVAMPATWLCAYVTPAWASAIAAFA